MLVGDHNEQFDFDESIDIPKPESRGLLCMNILCPPRTINEVQEWKVFLLRRLENLKGEEWPKLLLKILRETNHSHQDRIYQGEVTRVETLGYIEEENDRSKIMRATVIELKDHRSTKMSDDISRRKSKEDNSTEVLDEDPLEISSSKMFLSSEEASWMKASFDIKAKEDRESIIESFNYLRDIRDSSSTLEIANTTEEKMNIQNRVSSYRNQYDNYTVLVPNTIESLKDSNAQKASMEENMQKYKLIFKVIETHLTKPENIFRKLINQFESYYTDYYGNILDMYKKKEFSSERIKQYVSSGTTDLQQFIGILYESITLYYKLDKIKKESGNGSRNVLNRDNVMNFVTSIVFNQKIYQTIFDLFCTQDTEVEAIYKKNINFCENFNPEDFGIAEEYCLNNKTINYLRKEGRLRKTNTEVESTEDIEQPGYREVLEGSKRRYSKANYPYARAISALSDLKNRRSPLHKLKNIVKAAELISRSIDKFYKSQGTKNRKRLDADQTLSVFIYLVAKSGLQNVSAHYTIIEKFTTSNVLNSTAGYYATTLGACVACISSMDFQRNSTVQESEEDVRKFLRSSKIGDVSANSSIVYSGKN